MQKSAVLCNRLKRRTKVIAVLSLIFLILPFALSGCTSNKQPTEITSVSFDESKREIVVRGNIGKDVFDGKRGEVYLFSGFSEEGALASDYVAKAEGKDKFEFKYVDSESASAPYCGYIVAALSGNGEYIPLTALSYAGINESKSENEEAVRPINKKGIVTKSIGTALDLGCGNMVYDFSLPTLYSDGENGIEYKIGEKNYYFSESIVSGLDDLFESAKDHNIKLILDIIVTADDNTGSAGKAMIPDGADAGAICAPNLDSKEGRDAYCAAVTFLAERYAGKIDTLIVGKSADVAGTLNFGCTRTTASLAANAAACARVIYSAFASRSGGIKIYIPFSHDYTDAKGDSVGAKATLSKISELTSTGDFPWNAAFDLSPSSLETTDVTKDELCADSESTKYISVKNISVLKNYLSSISEGRYKRGLMISGFSVNVPEDEDNSFALASIVYGYLTAQNDIDIPAFVYSDLTDGQNKTGLMTASESGIIKEKPAYATYKFVNSDSSDGMSTSEAVLKMSESTLGYSIDETFLNINRSDTASCKFTEKIVGTGSEKGKTLGIGDIENNILAVGRGTTFELGEDGSVKCYPASDSLSGISLKIDKKIKMLSFKVTVDRAGGSSAADILLLTSGDSGKDVFEGSAEITNGAEATLSFDLGDYYKEIEDSDGFVDILLKPSGGVGTMTVSEIAIKTGGGKGAASAFIVGILMVALLLFIVFYGGEKVANSGRELPDEREAHRGRRINVHRQNASGQRRDHERTDRDNQRRQRPESFE